ncbi:MAG: hypothetical protein ABIH77_01790 [Pseudomonadota bacterium]|nr:hypothetical protein [Gammaproteobacteria bacterium]MBU1558643.1 hypothetical protein [Gammaproteobacteria bacterium]MBU1926843.1 hypothetical protein [Gammaproteobacteria bacterium]MBU2546160.1 hypothetical protein [Gammaproteobacteria bacterium]
MKMAFCFSLTGLFCCFALIGCQHARSVQSAPDLRTQCINLQRQQLFLNSQGHQYQEWELKGKQAQLQNDYQKLGCDKLKK